MKKSLFAYLLVFFTFAHSVLAESEHFIFIGNPGVGKSTIINSLIGKEVAQAGVSAATGMTRFFSAYEHAGKYYMDTPGLADVALREQAAKEIEAALKKDGLYKIFFMLTLEAGRVKPEDVTTINTVMDAIKIPDAGFNIIVNKLMPREKHHIFTDKVNMAAIYSQLNAGRHRTENIYYIENDRAIDDMESNFIKINSMLAHFIYEKSNSVMIASQDVEALKIDEFEAIKAQFEETLSQLKREIQIGNHNYQMLFNRMEAIQTEYAKGQAKIKKYKKKIIKLGEELDDERAARKRVQKGCI